MNEQQHSTGKTGEEIACRVAWPEGLASERQATLIPYRPTTTPVQFYILSVPGAAEQEFTPGVLVEAGPETDPAWYRVVSCAREELVGRALRPFPRAESPADPWQRFSTLDLARAFVGQVTRPRWFFDQSGLQLQAAVEDVTRVFGVAPDIWITQATLLLNGSRASLQIGEAGATFSLTGLQRVVGVMDGMACLQIQLPEEIYGEQRAWFEPGSGFWEYVELRYPGTTGLRPAWTVGDNRGV